MLVYIQHGPAAAPYSMSISMPMRVCTQLITALLRLTACGLCHLFNCSGSQRRSPTACLTCV